MTSRSRTLPDGRSRSGFRNRLRQIPGAVALARAARETYRRIRPALAPGPAILMYHRIADEAFDPWALSVSPANFAEHLEWIARKRVALPLDEFADANVRGTLPSNAMAVTFDDAYACTGTHAAPLLEKFGIPATIFISPELIQRGREFWWDEIERILLDYDGETVHIDGAELQLGNTSDKDRDWPAGAPPRTTRQHAYRALWSALHGRPLADIDAILVELRSQTGAGAEPRPSHRPLTVEELRSTASDLIAFGSHALTHPSLPQLPAEEQEREIAGSMAACAQLTGRAPTTFAYPFGDHVPQLDPIVERAGFTCACKADGWFVSRSSNRFALPRFFVRNTSARQLALQLGPP